jgi:hypothetical protein
MSSNFFYDFAFLFLDMAGTIDFNKVNEEINNNISKNKITRNNEKTVEIDDDNEKNIF